MDGRPTGLAALRAAVRSVFTARRPSHGGGLSAREPRRARRLDDVEPAVVRLEGFAAARAAVARTVDAAGGDAWPVERTRTVAAESRATRRVLDEGWRAAWVSRSS